MMKLTHISTHWTPEEAHNMLMLLDKLRDSIWHNYREEIIEYCRQQQVQESKLSTAFDNDIMPF